MNGPIEVMEGAKDLREELRRRHDWAKAELEKAIARQEQLQQEIARLNREVSALEDLLRFEEERWAPVQMGLPLARFLFAQVRLMDACLAVLRERGGEASNEEIAKALQEGGFPFGEKAPKRVVHFCLLGLRAAGKVVNLGEGRWQISDLTGNGNHHIGDW